MSVIERIAMCMNPHGTHEHIPLAPDEAPPETCFADCDCVPVVFVRADHLQGAVAESERLRAWLAIVANTTHDVTAAMDARRALDGAPPITDAYGGQ